MQFFFIILTTELFDKSVPLQEDLIAPPVGKSGASHPQVLHQTQILHLVPDQNLIKTT